MGEQASAGEPPPRIDTRKLATIFGLGLLLPVSTALAVDLLSGTFPFISVVVIVVCFPVATFLMSRTALRELDRVIQAVAPPEPEEAPPSEPGAAR